MEHTFSSIGKLHSSRSFLCLERSPNAHPRLPNSEREQSAETNARQRANCGAQAHSACGIAKQVAIRLPEVVFQMLLRELGKLATAAASKGGDCVSFVAHCGVIRGNWFEGVLKRMAPEDAIKYLEQWPFVGYFILVIGGRARLASGGCTEDGGFTRITCGRDILRQRRIAGVI